MCEYETTSQSTGSSFIPLHRFDHLNYSDGTATIDRFVVHLTEVITFDGGA